MQDYRFLRPLAPEGFAPPTAAPARQPLGHADSPYAHGLAAALDAIRRNPPQTAPALGEDLLAEALLRYAQRSTAEGQASPMAAADAGGGGYGPGPGAPGGPAANVSGADAGGVGYAPPAMAGGLGAVPISSLNLHEQSPAWTRVMQTKLPRVSGYGPAGGGF